MTEKVRNNIKNRLFPIENLDEIPIREPTRETTLELAKELTKHRKSQLKLQQEFMNEILANEKDKYYVIFWIYSSLSKSIAFRKRHN